MLIAGAPIKFAQIVPTSVKYIFIGSSFLEPISNAVFGQVALNFFKWRKARKDGIDKDLASNGDRVYPV